MSGRRRAGQRGFTLLELLIASALGLVVIMVATELLVGARQAERLERAHARLVDSARFATSLIGRALRESGYPGCHPALRRNLIADGLEPAWPPVDRIASVSAASAGDGLVIRSMRSLGRATILSTSADGERLRLDREHGLRRGQALVVAARATADCVLFHQAANTVDILHRGSGLDGLNRRPPGGYRPLAGGIELLVPERTVFYVDDAVGQPGVRSLYRRQDSRGGRREELVVGVERLKLRFGLDESGDGTVDRYVSAAEHATHGEVAAVQVDLLVASHHTPGVLDAPMRLDSGETAIDRRLYETVTLTIALRNQRP
ncbi:PilW family protein [Spiribacter sp. 221]|uniref:PilW family protein n=1 Tax=Spiribacter onubensis TaxID=3122420 RepID=UPI00349F7C27